MPVLSIDYAIGIALIMFMAGMIAGVSLRPGSDLDESTGWCPHCPDCGAEMKLKCVGNYHYVCPKGHGRR